MSTITVLKELQEKANGTTEVSPKHKGVNRYVPTIGLPNWNINDITREERSKIKSNIVPAITVKEEEYKAIIAYMYMKFPDLFDITEDNNLSIQWKYATHRFKSDVPITKEELKKAVNSDSFNMYALVYQDASRDFEPVLFGGSYFKEVRSMGDDEENLKYLTEDKTQYRGQGYVLHTDVNYRRMGLAVDSWTTEARLYLDNLIRYQAEIQNTDSARVTYKMYGIRVSEDKTEMLPSGDGITVTAPGRLKADGTRSGIRLLLDYDKPVVKDKFDSMDENMKNFYNPINWNFLEREGLTIEDLNKFWEE